MFKAIILAIAILGNAQVAEVVETYDDIMVVETQDGNLLEYEFDGMTEVEKFAEKVILVNDEVVVLK